MSQWQEDIVVTFRPTNAIIYSPILSTTSQLVVPANINRRRLLIHNDSGVVMFVAFAPTCSSSVYSIRLANQESYIGPLGDYTGDVSAVRNAGNGNGLHITEVLV